LANEIQTINAFYLEKESEFSRVFSMKYEPDIKELVFFIFYLLLFFEKENFG